MKIINFFCCSKTYTPLDDHNGPIQALNEKIMDRESFVDTCKRDDSAVADVNQLIKGIFQPKSFSKEEIQDIAGLCLTIYKNFFLYDCYIEIKETSDKCLLELEKIEQNSILNAVADLFKKELKNLHVWSKEKENKCIAHLINLYK